MRRSFVIWTSALALALLPAAVLAQTPPAQSPSQPPAGQTPPAGQQPPTGQPPAGQNPAGQTGQAPGAPAQPAAPKVTFKSNVGMMLVQVKPDQTAAFEEMIAKLRSGTASATDPGVKSQSTVRVYKSQEPGAGGNAFYVMLYEPATPGTEYSFLEVINDTLTPEQQRDPATRDMYLKWAGSIATMNLLNLQPVGTAGGV
jgi:hypothetical protein